MAGFESAAYANFATPAAFNFNSLPKPVPKPSGHWTTRVGKYVFIVNTGSRTISRAVGTGSNILTIIPGPQLSSPEDHRPTRTLTLVFSV